MGNLLSEVHPELIEQWSERNLPLTPDKITYGSNKIVWWKGACGHEWQTSIKARSNGENCPICSGARVVEGINDLATLKPELAAEWSSKNKTLKPTMVSVGSHKKVIWKGFEYLNELFIKRHKKILWNSTKKISYVCAFLVAAVLAGVYLLPEEKTVINEIVMTWLPYFVFIMYAINRGTNFTQALFMNCDHSLLTYSFYKQPSFILRLFQIRLREIMKINAVPALVIGIGLALILFATGGTDNPLNYVVLVVSILCMSLFFSIHYLTIYYLLQPYNAGTELKSGTYRIVLSVTYVVCFALMRLRMPIMIFGIMTIVFCVLYSIVASILVYRFAPKTFRLRT